MKKTLLILFLLPFALLSQNGKWEIIDTNVIKPLLNCIDCYDSLNCVAFGNYRFNEPHNRITSDGGRTWVTTLRDTQILGQYYPTKVYDVAYPDSSLCIAACGEGYYWISRDKCKTWERVRIGVPNDQSYVHFYDKNHGIFQNGSEIFITNDGAKTWDTVKCTSVFPGGCHDAKVISPNIIYTIVVKSDGYYLGRTYDNGKTWDRTDVINYKRFSNIIFIDKDVGFGIGGSGVPNTNYYNELVEKTTDAGVSWTKKLDSVVTTQNGRLLKGSFFGRDYGVVINNWGHIWKTLDGGETWFYDKTYPKDWADIGDIHWLTENKIIAVNKFYSQIIMYTEDITDVEEDYREVDENIILISPNPATDYIEINNVMLRNEVTKNPFLSVKVFDVLGNTVLALGDSRFRGNDMRGSGNDMNDSEGEKVRLDISALAPGVYFVKVGGQVSKFVKM